MTRDEAIKNVGGNAVRASEIVHALESLGLLKLEPPKPEWHRDVIEAVRNYPGTHSIAPISVVYAIERAGLKVVRA